MSAKGRLGDKQPPLFILRPLLISEANRARKLKFGTLVLGLRVNIFQLRGVWGSATPTFYFIFLSNFLICISLLYKYAQT